MSQKSLQPSSRKRKPLELKNQPKMTGFVLSSPKPQATDTNTKLKPEESTAFRFSEEKYRYLFESTPAQSSKKQRSKKQVIQIGSDTSEPEMATDDSPVFARKVTKVAKKPLFSHKDLFGADNQDLPGTSKKGKEQPVRDPLKSSSFNISKKKEGTITKFSSEYNDDSEVPKKPKKKRFHMESGDSKDSQIDIPPSPSKSTTKRKSSKNEERRVKRKRDDKDPYVVESTSSSNSVENNLKIVVEDKHIPKNFKEILAKPRGNDKQAFSIGNLPIKKRIIRKSALNADNTSQQDSIHISKKMLADYEATRQGARLAYMDSHKDLETLLGMQLDRRLCPDLSQAISCERNVLSNRYHVNFEFFMQRDDYEAAVSSMRSVSRNHYPNKKDLHAILYSIIEKTNEEGVLHRAQDLLYKVVSLHPPVDQTMREYYSFLLSSRANETDISAPWENLRNLIEEALSEDETGNESLVNSNLTAVERKKAILGFLVQLLYEDFCCWLNCTSNYRESLRLRKETPLVANVLWPRSTIPAVNSNCRELIKLHITALESSQPEQVFFTQPLVKMLAAITQLTDLTLPLTFRKPSEDMMNLAREIVILANGSDLMNQSDFFTSFGSHELQLLIPLVVLCNLKPTTAITNLQAVTLKDLIKFYLKVENEPEPEKVLESFKEETAEYRRVLVSALSAYFELFGSFKAWHSITRELRYPNVTKLHVQEPDSPVDIFSSSFTFDDFLEDLRQANTLFKKVSIGNRSPKKSLYSFLALNSH